MAREEQQMSDVARYPNGKPDYFRSSTESLNGHMREIIDAIRFQLSTAPIENGPLRRAAKRLNDSAVEFTNTLYRSFK